jgi:crotonobetainyl-CoA:carnitine CoA-transferase CaiB-like acyl-CoA transferase
MMQFAVTGKAAAPMPSRISAWGVYDVFTVKNDEQIFLAAVSYTQWALLCEEFGLAELKADARLGSNNARVLAREWLIPLLRTRFESLTARELSQRFERVGLPYAPITQPHELFDDPHLLATGGLAPTTVPADGSGAGRAVETRSPLLPIALDGQRLPLRRNPPALGADTEALMQTLGYDAAAIARLREDGVVGIPAGSTA